MITFTKNIAKNAISGTIAIARAVFSANYNDDDKFAIITATSSLLKYKLRANTYFTKHDDIFHKLMSLLRFHAEVF